MNNPIRAASAECAGCHYIFPKPEMRRLQYNVGGGYQSGRRTERFTNFGQRTGYSETQGYWRKGRNVTEWYCQSCFRKERKKGVAINISFLGFIGIFAVAIFYWPLNKSNDSKSRVEKEQNIPTNDDGAIISSRSIQTPTQSIVSEIDSENRVNTETQSMNPERSFSGGDSNQTQVRMDDEGGEVAPELLPTPATSKSLSRSIEKAIRTGKADRWEDGRYAGYVVVSDPEQFSGCVSYYYNIDSGSAKFTSDTVKHCPEN